MHTVGAPQSVCVKTRWTQILQAGCVFWLIAATALGTPQQGPDDLVPGQPAFFEIDAILKHQLELRDRLELLEGEHDQRVFEVYWLPEQENREYIFMALNRWESFHESGVSTFTYELEVRHAPMGPGEMIVQRLKIDQRLALRMAACWKQMCLRTRPSTRLASVLGISSEYHNFRGPTDYGGWMPMISGTQGKLFNMVQAAYSAQWWVRMEGVDEAKARSAKARVETMVAQLEKRLKKR